MLRLDGLYIEVNINLFLGKTVSRILLIHLRDYNNYYELLKCKSLLERNKECLPGKHRRIVSAVH